MAIFGKLEVVRQQLHEEKFIRAFEYLLNVMDEKSEEHKRLLNYSINAFEKIEIDADNFALEQTYYSKDRENCFFESHQKYIDVQFIVEGEEIIEVDFIDNLLTVFSYDSSLDLIKYDDSSTSSIIKLKKGDIAIFYPEDAHMPCIKINDSIKVIKTVVKVKV